MKTAYQNITNYFYALTKIVPYRMQANDKILIFVTDQIDAQFFFVYLCIPILYMFLATKCSSSGESTVSI